MSGPGGYGDHALLKSLLGAWALSACSKAETAAVEEHLTECGACAEEALRLRDAVGLLHPQDSLDVDPALRTRVLDICLSRREPRIPVPPWVVPYDSETARLDALLHDMGEAEWGAPVTLTWCDGDHLCERTTSVAGVIGHLMAVDGLPALTMGLPDPLRAGHRDEGAVPSAVLTHPDDRTEALWKEAGSSYEEQQRLSPELRRSHAGTVRRVWRDQTYTLIRTTAFAGATVADLAVPYGPGVTLPLRDALLDRAFACWTHASDIAQAVDYPYATPAPEHLNQLIDLAARLLPRVLAERRRSGRAAPARTLVAAGSPGRSLHLEVEGAGGGDWFIPLDSPAALGSRDDAVAHVALEDVEFCRVMAGHVIPADAAAGQDGDRGEIADFLRATAALSRL